MDVPEVAVPDPAVPMPVALPRAIAEVRQSTPPTSFAPPPRPQPPAQPAAPQTSAPRPAAQQGERAASPQQAVGNQPSASSVERWQGSVLRHLAQRRKFPPGAAQRGERGTAIVRFTVDTGGRVLSAALSRSSGFPELDQAAVDVVHRSSPIPRPPDGLPSSQLTLVVPVEFTRR